MEKAILKKRRTGGASKHEETCEKRTLYPAQSRFQQALGLGTRFKFMCSRYSHTRVVAFSTCCGWHYHIRKIMSIFLPIPYMGGNILMVKSLVMRWLAL